MAAPVMAPATTIRADRRRRGDRRGGPRGAGAAARMVYGGPAAPARRRERCRRAKCCARRIVLPAAVEENLRQALAYDLDRHTPFKPEELYFDAAIVDRDAARSTITVDLAAARRADRRSRAASTSPRGARRSSPSCPSRRQRAARSRLNLLPRGAAHVARRVWTPLAILAAGRAARGRWRSPPS